MDSGDILGSLLALQTIEDIDSVEEHLQKSTILNYAVKNNATDLIYYIVDRGANPNLLVGRHCSSPLQFASRRGYAEVCTALIDVGADVNKVDDVNWSPLHFAAYWGHTEVAKVLIEAGAKLNVQTSNKETPLHIAVNKTRVNVVQTLVSAGANLDVLDHRNRTPLRISDLCEDFAKRSEIRKILSDPLYRSGA